MEPPISPLSEAYRRPELYAAWATPVSYERRQGGKRHATGQDDDGHRVTAEGPAPQGFQADSRGALGAASAGPEPATNR